ncbi:hypothetical protein AJ78_04911 [Emergomyces pasteurianus Ep9510]|uniref:Phosphatidylglycerol/phosphatidylinositol transfer protein n=1 Tax=Emergomyces pasteurianus Ep9510 TaxID=1447872 RepID=A0A1J9QHW3_9EURO|nr:hypothetical protein AJ78_04911 [Emergomyces pasteurianus Ep9510]
MHLTATPILALIWSSLAVGAPSIAWFSESQTPISLEGKKLGVPGNNPLYFCSQPETDILTIESVNLSPNPPVPGQTLAINASGTFSKQVDEGAKVQVQVKYGLIRLINQEADLCQEISNVNMECPLEEGKMSFTKLVELPKEIPPGKYTVLADVYTKDKERITCLKAEVTFGL